MVTRKIGIPKLKIGIGNKKKLAKVSTRNGVVSIRRYKKSVGSKSKSHKYSILVKN